MELWRKIRPYLSWVVRFTHISYIETASNYSATRLGMLWSPVSSVVFAATLALVFRPDDSGGFADFFLYVLAGYTLWSFITESITGSTDIIQSRLDFALHNNLTVAQLYAKLLIDRLFFYGLNLCAVILMMLLLRPGNLGPMLLLVIPFLLLISIASVGGSYLVNLMTIFAPDTKVPISVVTRLLFFISPVFWAAGSAQQGTRALLVDLNPVAYFLSLPRQIFGLEPPDIRMWGVAVACSALLGVAGYAAYLRSITVVRNLK